MFNKSIYWEYEAYYPVSTFCFSTGKYDVYAAQSEQEQALEKPAEPGKQFL